MRFTLMILALAGCTLSLDGAKCPCATGWTCCDNLRTCVRLGDACPTNDGGGESCLPGEDCPGDPIPEKPVGIINLGVAQFGSDVITPDTDLLVTFPIVIHSLNRDTTFRVLTSSFLLGPPATRMETTALDEHDQPTDNLVLPKTDQMSQSRIVKVRVKVPALPSGMTQAPANIVVSLSNPANVSIAAGSQANAPSSGQILFTVGAAAPPPNAFPIVFEFVTSPGSFDAQYAILTLPTTNDIAYFWVRADLTQMPAGEVFTSETKIGDAGWPVMAGPQTIMPSSDGRSPFAIFFNGVPQDAPPTTVDVTVRGSQHVATTRFSLQP